MSFEFTSSVMCPQLRNLHQHFFCFCFFFFYSGESFNVGFPFFCNFKKKKKKKIHRRWFPFFFLQLQAKKKKKIDQRWLPIFFATSSKIIIIIIKKSINIGFLFFLQLRPKKKKKSLCFRYFNNMPTLFYVKIFF